MSSLIEKQQDFKGSINEVPFEREEVVDAKRRIAKTMYDSIKSAFDTQMLHINEASMLICLGRPFTGLVTDSDCLANLLANNFQKKIITVQVDNPHLANAQALQDACR